MQAAPSARGTTVSGVLSVAVMAALGVFIAVGFVATTLAVLGVLRPLPFVVGVALLVPAALWVVRPGRAAAFIAPATWAPALVLATVVLFTGMQFRYSAEHVLGDRDPGIYLNTARLLADEGELVIDKRGEEPFVADPDVSLEAPGFEEDDTRGVIYPQFAHLLPALMAPADWIGPDRALFKVPALLGALALLAFHAFASRVLRPWFAAFATLALAVNPVFVHFSRDAFSEIPALIALFGGLALLWDARGAGDARRALAAGLLLGMVAMARIDGLFLAIPLVAFIGVEVVRAQLRERDDPARAATLRLAGAVALGAVPPVVLGFIDVRLRSPFYFSDLRSELVAIAAGVIAVAVLGAIVALVARRFRARAASLESRLSTLATPVAVVVLLGGLAAWLIRPHVQEMHYSRPNPVLYMLKFRRYPTLDPTRNYFENTLGRIAWYIGVVTLAAALIGLAIWVRRVLADKDVRLLPFLFLFGAETALYVWRPRINPDHIWTMRRFLPITIPGLVLAAVFVAEWVVTRFRADQRVGRLAVAVAGALIVAILAAPALALRPIRSEQTQAGMYELVQDVCGRVGPSAAVAFVARPPTHLFPPVMTFCERPVANLPARANPREVTVLARDWAERDVDLYVAAMRRRDVTALVPGAEVIAVTADTQSLEATVKSRPSEIVHEPYTVFLARAGG
jgi:hypothetical protein